MTFGLRVRYMGLAFGLALLFTLDPAPIAAQIQGKVVDVAGAPLSDAVVDLWSPTMRLARQVTSTDGRFHFDSTTGAVRVTARRIGSRAAVLGLHAANGDLVLVLAPAPVSIEELSVDAQRCTNREDRVARQRWASAAKLYGTPAESLWVSSALKLIQERVPIEKIGRPDLDSTGFGWTGGKSSAFSLRSWQFRVDQSGFPAVDPESSSMGSELGGLMHRYWVSPAFGSAFVLTMLDASTLRFCPRHRSHPWLEGEMGLAEDGSILWVRWRYGASRPQPASGGIALFLAPGNAEHDPLLPSTESAWQERPNGMAAQRTFEYREWQTTAAEPHWGRSP